MGFRCPFIFIRSLLTITIFPNIVIIIIIYYYRELHVTIIVFSRSFCLLSVFSQGFCWRRLTLSVFLLFRLTASSRPGFPYSPFSSNALSSGAVVEPSPVQTSKSKLLYIQKDPLDGAASFFPLTVLQIKDLPRWWTRRTHAREKLFCSWRELNPDRPVASPTFYL